MVQTRRQLALDQAEEVEDQRRQSDGKQKRQMKKENPNSVERMAQISIKMILGIIVLVGFISTIIYHLFFTSLLKIE